MATRFAIPDDAAFSAWLEAQPRALVLYRGVGCPYSATFEKVFLEIPAPGWSIAIREVEEGGEGPAGEALGIEITPTVGAFRDGREERLKGKLLLGLTRSQYKAWLKKLG